MVTTDESADREQPAGRGHPDGPEQRDRPDQRDGADQRDDPADVVERVGPRLRQLRHARAMTLSQLSEATGITLSTLSRLEAGQRRPTLSALLQLARVYRVTLDDLVGAPLTDDPRVHLRPSTRHGMTWLPLSRRPGGPQAFKLIIPAGGHDCDREQRSHEGHEWTYVLQGRLQLLLGQHDLVLTSGEVAEYDTRTPHAFRNPGDVAVEMLILLGPEGERAHVRARPAHTA